MKAVPESLNVSLPKLEDSHQKHPCFSYKAHKKFARMHLPVAPKCNMACNYCNRKYDCSNESRPGVTSKVLSAAEALQRFLMVRSQFPNLSVVGIAGPGDALADWENTRTALEMIRRVDKDIHFCLSTNGLLLDEYLPEIIDLGIGYVTVTVNFLTPEVGEKLCRFIEYHGTQYKGWEGAALLSEKQMQGIARIASKGITVKINTVMISGINDHQIPDMANKMKGLGASLHNIVPLIPVQGSVFADYPQTSAAELLSMRERCRTDLAQMSHCRQCRADAIGMLNDDRCLQFIQAG